MHRNNLFKPNTFVLAKLSIRKLTKTSFMNTHFPHFTAGRAAPRFALYHLSSRDYRITCSVSEGHTISSMTTAATQGNEIRASEDPRAILSPTSAQIRHEHAKLEQPAPRPPNLKHVRLRSTGIPQTSPPQNLAAHASK